MDPPRGKRPAWALLQVAPDLPDRPRVRPQRRPRGAVLDHPMRRRVLEAIAADPGCIASAVARRLGANSNVVRFHLRVLEGAGYVHAPAQGRRRRYLMQHHARIDAESWARRVSPAAQRILRHLGTHGPARFRALCEATALPPSTASAAVRQLVAAGLVDKVGTHRVLIVRLRPGLALPPPPAAAQVLGSEPTEALAT